MLFFVHLEILTFLEIFQKPLGGIEGLPSDTSCLCYFLDFWGWTIWDNPTF